MGVAIHLQDMDRIWVGRAGQKFGPFSPAGILVAERQKKLGANDLLWWPGLPRPAPVPTGLAAVREALSQPKRAEPRVARLDAAGADSIPVLTQVEDAVSPRDLDYAGFGVRAAAAGFDGALVLVAALVITGVWAAAGGGFRAGGLFAVVFVVGAVYAALLEAGPRSATLGKAWLGLQVRHAYTRSPITPLRAFVRSVGRLASALPLAAGYLMQLRTIHRQTLHDRIACTVVLAASPLRRERLHLGYALAVLVPIVAIAAALLRPVAESPRVPADTKGVVRPAPAPQGEPVRPEAVKKSPAGTPKRPVVPDFDRGK